MQTNNERHPVDKLKISANGPLNGEIIVSGAKNAALPLMCAGLLTSGTLRLKNVPMLADVKTTQKTAARHGRTRFDRQHLRI